MKHVMRLTGCAVFLALLSAAAGCSGGPTLPTQPNNSGGNSTATDPSQNLLNTLPTGTAPAGAGPKVVVEKDRMDAGEMEYGRTQDYTFPIRNTGDRPLTLTVRSRDCSCAEITGLGDVPPGKNTEVKIRWTLRAGHVGKHSLTTVLGTNDPSKPTVRLTVSADINPAVRVSPANWDIIDFERLPPGQPAERVFNVFSSKLSAFELDAHFVEHKDEPAAFEIKVAKLEPEEQLDGLAVKSGYKVTLRSLEKLPRGYLHRDLAVDVLVPGEPKRSIWFDVYAFVPASGFTVGPEEIAFKAPNIGDGDETRATVRFDVPTGKETVDIVRVEPSFVEVAEKPHQAGNGVWLFKLRVPKDNAEARKYQPDNFFEGRVILKVTPGGDEVPVRLKWVPGTK